LFLLSAIHRLPAESTATSCMVLNSASPAGTGPGSPATRPRPLERPFPAIELIVPDGSMRRMRAPAFGSFASWAT